VTFVERVWPKTIEVVEAEVRHPHLQELAEGTLDVNKFRFQAKQNYKYLVEYARALAVGMAKCPDHASMERFRAYLNQIMDNEIPFYKKYYKEKLGIDEKELEDTVMSSIKRAYTSHEIARAWEGTLAEMFAAILPCDLCYWEVAKRLKAICELPEGNIYREWIYMYVSEEFSRISEDAIDCMNRLAEGKSEEEMRRLEEIYLVSCQYELLSWDMYYTMQTWPLPHLFGR